MKISYAESAFNRLNLLVIINVLVKNTSASLWLTQSLFGKKVLTLSCNVLATVLKVTNRKAVGIQKFVSISIVDPCDHLADRELPR